MDHLQELIQALNTEEKKDFLHFVQRYSDKENRKDLELFYLLVEEKNYTRAELLRKIYPKDENLEAYHATRKRLFRQLNDYIFVARTKLDKTQLPELKSNIELCRFLFAQQKYESAWYYLKRAEEIAFKGNYFALLEEIYALTIEFALHVKAVDLDAVIQKKKFAQQQRAIQENALTANHLIRNRLHQSMAKGEELAIDTLVAKTLAEYQLTDIVADNVRLIFNIISITRSVALNKKDFYAFEPYILRQYDVLVKRNLFDKYNHDIKTHLLYIIAHTLYRNKKFKASDKYCALLLQAMYEHNKMTLNAFYQRYVLLRSVILTYTNNAQQAITLLEEIVAQKRFHIDKPHLLNTYINLSINYFYLKQYDKSIRNFRNLNHTDLWYQKVMGREWLMKKVMLEIMNHYELGNSDIVVSKVQFIERTFADFLQIPAYQRVKTFLLFVKKLNNDPGLAHFKNAEDLLESSFEYLPKEVEDIQAMAFYGWIKSKIYKTDFYATVLEIVNV
jgi:hypothetical protein